MRDVRDFLSLSVPVRPQYVGYLSYVPYYLHYKNTQFSDSWIVMIELSFL